MTPNTRQTLREAARALGTPLFVYFEQEMVDRARHLKEVFGDLFSISFAVKCNPNIEILKCQGASMGCSCSSGTGALNR